MSLEQSQSSDSTQQNQPSQSTQSTQPRQEKQFLIEYFVDDKELIQEYQEHMRPIKERFKYTLFYDTLLCLGAFQYAKNVTYYSSKFFPNRGTGLASLLWISSLHCVLFSAVFFAGNFAILGIRPVQFYRRHRELEARLMQHDPNPNMTFGEFMDVLNTHVNIDVDEISKEDKRGKADARI